MAHQSYPVLGRNGQSSLPSLNQLLDVGYPRKDMTPGEVALCG